MSFFARRALASPIERRRLTFAKLRDRHTNAFRDGLKSSLAPLHVGNDSVEFLQFLLFRDTWDPLEVGLIAMPFFNEDLTIQLPLLGAEPEDFSLLISDGIEHFPKLNAEFFK
jgi:hypothetical protein